jgi:uncharacterized protein YkwD
MLYRSSAGAALVAALVLSLACQSDVVAGVPGSETGDPALVAARDTILSLTNAARADEGAGGPLSSDAGLDAVAQAHAEDMANRGYFSHTNPEGEQPWDRAHNAGVTFSLMGENIAINFSAAGAVSAWMNSTGHRENILREGFGRLGIGVHEGHYVQLFAN